MAAAQSLLAITTISVHMRPDRVWETAIILQKCQQTPRCFHSSTLLIAPACFGRLFLGLENAGKSAMIHVLSSYDLVQSSNELKSIIPLCAPSERLKTTKISVDGRACVAMDPPGTLR